MFTGHKVLTQNLTQVAPVWVNALTTETTVNEVLHSYLKAVLRLKQSSVHPQRMSPMAALHGPGNTSPWVLLCVCGHSGCSQSAPSPGIWVNTMAEVDSITGAELSSPLW